MSGKLNAFTLSGLMIGPVLGSGILFLPPLAYQKLGNHAIVAWVITMAMGAVFAYVFCTMNAAAPNNQGVSGLIGSVLGKRYGALSANYLSAAIAFGPAAVALTAAGFFATVFPAAERNQSILAAAVLIVSAVIVLLDVSFMGKIILALSSLAACLLLAGSAATIVLHPAPALPQSLPPAAPLGSTLLLLFWAVFGWEVLGNYTEDVADPARTTMRAMKLSLAAIISVYLVSALALQQSRSASMSDLLAPLFGGRASVIFGIIAAGLCVCTIAAFTGAVTRQTAARLRALRIPAALQKHKTAVLALLGLNLLVVLCHAIGWLTFETIVGSANALFIGNAFVGLVCGFRLMRNPGIRASIGILLVMMLMIFLFSPPYAMALFACVTLAGLLYGKAAPHPARGEADVQRTSGTSPCQKAE